MKNFWSSAGLPKEHLRSSELKGKESTFIHHTIHYGGIIARTDNLLHVGGYGAGFIGWGYQDRDLQEKIAKVFDLRIFPTEPGFLEISFETIAATNEAVSVEP